MTESYLVTVRYDGKFDQLWFAHLGKANRFRRLCKVFGITTELQRIREGARE